MKRIAKIILFKGDQVLLQLRDNNPKIPYPNTWSLFGGVIEENETPEETLRREIKEETGQELTELKLVYTGQRKEDNILVEDNVFAGEILCEVSDLTLTEGQEARFFNIKELDKINIMPTWKKVIKEYFKAGRIS